jgi:anti-sigma regulatory factor (Ser/Thr protein kinase)
VTEKINTWGLAELTETAELLVSELVTNAVQASEDLDPEAAERYARHPYAVKYQDLIKVSCVRLRISSDGRRLLIEVWDRNPNPPVTAELDGDGLPNLESEAGRGLFLVGAYATQWGWYYPADRDLSNGTRSESGKVVWCTASR